MTIFEKKERKKDQSQPPFLCVGESSAKISLLSLMTTHTPMMTI